jgi:GNAT superfamily N-acetyltransferase
LKERFSRGDLCFAGMARGGIVSVAFATFNQVYLREVDYHLKFSQKACALFDSYTLTGYRRHGFYKAVQNSLLSHLARLGFEVVYLWVSASNKAAFEAHNSLGFKNIVQEIILDQRLGLKRRVVRECNISVDRFLKGQ